MKMYCLFLKMGDSNKVINRFKSRGGVKHQCRRLQVVKTIRVVMSWGVGKLLLTAARQVEWSGPHLAAVFSGTRPSAH